MDRKKWFLDIFENKESKLLRFVFKLTKNEEVAREIVQDVFVKFWEKFSDTDLGRETEWLFTVARNASYDHLRKNKKIHVSLEDLVKDIPDSTLGADQMIERNQEVKELSERIDQLTELQKEVLQLKFAEDMSYQEISKVTGMSPNHVAVFVFNIMKKFRPLNSKKGDV